MPITEDWLRELPKAEVHVHLEGSLSEEEIERLCERRGEQVRPRFGADLGELLDYLDWTCGLVETEDDLSQLAAEFTRRKADSGVRYMDVVVNPTHWGNWQERLGDFLDALDRGFAEAEAGGGPAAGLCVSLLRTQSGEEAVERVKWLIEREHPRVSGLSIDGNEAAAGRTGERFAPAFDLARKAGMPRTVHAGESSGPEGMRDAIELLSADRIDHGVRAIDDPTLVAELARRAIPLGVCPVANGRLGLYPELDTHPVDRLRRAGVSVSVNTDDPVAPDVSLVQVYRRCAETFGWDEGVVRELARTSIEASFAAPQEKAKMLEDLDRFPS